MRLARLGGFVVFLGVSFEFLIGRGAELLFGDTKEKRKGSVDNCR